MPKPPRKVPEAAVSSTRATAAAQLSPSVAECRLYLRHAQFWGFRVKTSSLRGLRFRVIGFKSKALL